MQTTSPTAILGFSGEYEFLSNFHKGEPLHYWLIFDTAEHMFNALKTLDNAEAMWVSAAPTPSEAKRRGRQVTLRPNWDSTERFIAMRRTLGAKFLPDIELQKKLLATGDAYLEESNTCHDQIWGNCTCGREACAEQGQNHLGVLLMELRDDLRKWS